MVGLFSQLKSKEFSILSCGKGLGPRPRPQLRMWKSSGFILYLKRGYCKSEFSKGVRPQPPKPSSG